MRSTARPRPKASLEQLLDAEQSAFDQLMARVRSGALTAPQFDQLEEDANGICSRIRAAFRGGRL